MSNAKLRSVPYFQGIEKKLGSIIDSSFYTTIIVTTLLLQFAYVAIDEQVIIIDFNKNQYLIWLAIIIVSN